MRARQQQRNESFFIRGSFTKSAKSTMVRLLPTGWNRNGNAVLRLLLLRLAPVGRIIALILLILPVTLTSPLKLNALCGYWTGSLLSSVPLVVFSPNLRQFGGKRIATMFLELPSLIKWIGQGRTFIKFMSKCAIASEQMLSPSNSPLAAKVILKALST